jgi:uncharacterized protein YcfL
MRFLRVVLSIALLVGCVPFPVAAEGVAPDNVQTVATNTTQVERSTIEGVAEALPESEQPKIGTTETTPATLIAQEQVIEENPTDSLVKENPIITEVQTAGTDEFVELYNPNNEPLPLTGLSLWYRGSGTSIVQLVDLNSIILQPKAFVVFGHIATTVNPVISFEKTSYSLNDTMGEIFISQSASGNAMDKVAWGSVSAASGYIFDVKPAVVPPKNNSLQRCFLNGAVVFAGPRDTSKEFSVYGNDAPTPFVGMACVVPDPPELVNNCEGLRINEIAANSANQFIELQNSTSQTISLDGCQLQTNRSTTKSYVFGAETLPAGAYRTVPISETELTLTKTTSGIVYLLSSDGLVEVDSQAYVNLASDTSWSRIDDGTWWQTYAPTPGSTNVIQKYLPCDDGYVRNVDTGRCNKIVASEASADCGDGKYRSEDTGRCRTIPVASVLAACKLGQYRNEETNRCRNIVTASIQKPCKDNQYRSEETNRCRNITATHVPESAFAVQPVKDTAMAFVGWWALGGVGVLAAGYGVWEWRREMRVYFGRVISGLSGKK